MTFWHLSAVFSEHLAHLPSPVIVTSSLSLAKVVVARESRTSPAMLVNTVIVFFIICLIHVMGPVLRRLLAAFCSIPALWQAINLSGEQNNCPVTEHFSRS